MNMMDEVKIVVDGLRNGMFENYPDLDEALLPQFEYLLSIIEQDKAEISRLTGLLNELTACCEYMNIINGRCISCEAIREG